MSIICYNLAANLFDQPDVNATVTMSRVYYGSYGYSYDNRYKAINVIDGSTQQDPDSCQCCAVTEASGNQWLDIELQDQHRIQFIQITGATDGNICSH